jgi:hypothetical protein
MKNIGLPNEIHHNHNNCEKNWFHLKPNASKSMSDCMIFFIKKKLIFAEALFAET